MTDPIPPEPSPDSSVGSPHERIEALLGELERLEAQFEQVQAHLSRSHKLETLGSLASVIAHEYNNLLTPIINYATLALNQEAEDPALMRKALQKSLVSAQRATRISESLLGLARPEAAEEEAGLGEAVDEALNCLARHPTKDGVELVTDLPAASVAMSPLNLQQVLVNLLLNAKKAMRHSGGRIHIRGQLVSLDAVRLEVADTGPGIPESIRHQLFEPFVTKATEPAEAHHGPGAGTGLGLSICRDLVQQAGGRIEVASEPGQGTTFALHLPRAHPAESEGLAAASPSPDQSTNGDQQRVA